MEPHPILHTWFHFLNKTFISGWIIRGSEFLPWSPRSPDLTPCDFYLWGVLKHKIYSEPQPKTLEELEEKIIATYLELPEVEITPACLSVPGRFTKCRDIEGCAVSKS